MDLTIDGDKVPISETTTTHINISHIVNQVLNIVTTLLRLSYGLNSITLPLT